MSEVSQRARELLAAVYDEDGAESEADSIRDPNYRTGRASFNEIALRSIDKAFVEETAAIVGWLRNYAEALEAIHTVASVFVAGAANKIEAGEHHEG